ncbi:hypothetical protein Tco_0134782 [Tanacetum coccineum]
MMKGEGVYVVSANRLWPCESRASFGTLCDEYGWPAELVFRPVGYALVARLIGTDDHQISLGCVNVMMRACAVTFSSTFEQEVGNDNVDLHDHEHDDNVKLAQPLVDEVIRESKKRKRRQSWRHGNGTMLLKLKVPTIKAFSMGMMILWMVFCQCPIRKEIKFPCLAAINSPFD